MPRDLLVTVDVEQDISKYLSSSFLGLSQGVPFLLDLFKQLGIRGSFFVQGLVSDAFPEIVLEIKRRGHSIGCHGYYHLPYGERFAWDVDRDVAASTNAILRVTGDRPVMFRAVEFSLTRRLVRVLENYGFMIDSSALNNYRRSFLWGFARRALPYRPEQPYVLSKETRPKGKGKVIEVPVTENPRFPGSPLGLGFLNLRGVEQTIGALREVRSSYCTFLIHPWEAVDFPVGLKGLPDWVRTISRKDEEVLGGFLGWAKDEMDLTDFPSLISAR